MFEKSHKRPKILNPGKTCADCIHHICENECINKIVCKSYCEIDNKRIKCHASAVSCERFERWW